MGAHRKKKEERAAKRAAVMVAPVPVTISQGALDPEATRVLLERIYTRHQRWRDFEKRCSKEISALEEEQEQLIERMEERHNAEIEKASLRYDMESDQMMERHERERLRLVEEFKDLGLDHESDEEIE
jgi:hypothetical protein